MKNTFNPDLIKILKTKKVFIFDFDGTITSSNNIIFKAMQAVCKLYGYDFTQRDFEDVRDKPSSEYFEKMKKVIHVSLNQNTVAKQYTDACDEILKTEKLECFDYVFDLIKLFPDKTFVVASNNLEEYLKNRLEEMGIAKQFSKIFACGNDIHKNYVYNNTKTLLNANPEECVVFEDAEKYVLQAQEAGITTVGILHTYNEQILTSNFFVDAELKKEKQS